MWYDREIRLPPLTLCYLPPKRCRHSLHRSAYNTSWAKVRFHPSTSSHKSLRSRSSRKRWYFTRANSRFIQHQVRESQRCKATRLHGPSGRRSALGQDLDRSLTPPPSSAWIGATQVHHELGLRFQQTIFSNTLVPGIYKG